MGEAGEMAQELKISTSLAEDHSLLLNTQIRLIGTCNSSSADSAALCWPHRNYMQVHTSRLHN